MTKENKKITAQVELTLEELDLIRRATWALESHLEEEIKEHNQAEEDHFYKTKPYWIRGNERNKNLYFDSKDLREKIVGAVGDMRTYDERRAYEVEHNLSAGDLSERYSNTVNTEEETEVDPLEQECPLSDAEADEQAMRM